MVKLYVRGSWMATEKLPGLPHDFAKLKPMDLPRSPAVNLAYSSVGPIFFSLGEVVLEAIVNKFMDRSTCHRLGLLKPPLTDTVFVTLTKAWSTVVHCFFPLFVGLRLPNIFHEPTWTIWWLSHDLGWSLSEHYCVAD